MSIDTSKIIHAPVGGGRYTVTAPIVKEDYGLYLLIEGLELPATYEVDFSNSEHNGTSVTMIGNSDGVLIPSQFIASGKDVFAFLYHVGDNYGRTVFKFRIPNKCRPDRTDEQPTPEEQSVIDQAISALNSAVEQTAQDVIDADASAQSASADADRAEETKVDAQNFATQAEQSAQNAHASASQASASATASAQSASQSAQIKSDVEGMVDDAQASASASANSATASANSASQASGYAQSASASATSAQGYASQAQTSAQTASSKASEASTSASTASAKATEASQSATNAQTYATQAESAKTSAQTAQGKAEDAQTAAETAQGKAEDAQEAAESAAASVSASASQIATNTADIADLQTDVAQNEADILKAFPVDSASGAIASFTDGADGLPLKSLVVNIDPVQDLHGYDSPWVGGGGRNKFDLDNATLAVGYGGAFRKNGYHDVTVYKTSTGIASDERDTNCGRAVCLGLLSADTYIVSFVNQGDASTTFSVVYTDTNVLPDDGAIERTTVISAQRQSIQFEADGTHYYWLSAYYISADNYKINDIMLRKSTESDASYAPYENICPISGWTGCNVQYIGKNLFDPNEYLLAGATKVEGADAEGHADVYTGKKKDFYRLHGNVKTNPSATGLIPRLPYGRLTISFYKFIENNDQVWFHYTDAEAWVNHTGNTSAIGHKTYTSDANRVCDGVALETTQGSTATYKFGDLQIEVASAETEYESYNGTTIPISWQTEAGTVYGGKLDVLSGVMRVNRKIRTVDTISNVASAYIHSDGVDGCVLDSDIQPRLNPMLQSTQYCNKLKFQAKAIWTDGISEPNVFAINQSQIHIKIANDLLGITDYTQETTTTAKEKLNAWLAENPVTLTIPIEPIEVQLELHVVNSILGVNNIFADTGDTAVEYRADTKLYISRLTEPDADMVADSNIVSGQYFMVGNNLYKATANIANGGQIVVGTNCTRVSLAQALNEINS